MTKNAGFLVVGGDSLVGGGVTAALKRRSLKYMVSTRRRETLDDGRVLLDFESDDPFVSPAGIDYAFIIAAATNYDRCETDPRASVVNAKLIPQLAGSLLEQGLFVTLISTNSVFGGERPWPQEEDTHAPGIAYAQQKSQGEDAVNAIAAKLNASSRINIVRLTKILNAATSPLPAWIDAWKRGEPVQPFTDLIFAPMSVKFVGEALVTVGEKRVSGNLHLSGADNVSYEAFARALAKRMGVNFDLINPTTSVAKGVNIPFKPTYSGLGMTRTTRLTKIEPQRLDSVIEDLVADMAI